MQSTALSEWRRDTPGCAQHMHLNNAGAALMPRPVVDAVIGHDFGSSVAAWCALIRPDVFRSVVMMSAPFGGVPALPFNTADAPAKPTAEDVKLLLNE